jgi:hypothetical protein
MMRLNLTNTSIYNQHPKGDKKQWEVISHTSFHDHHFATLKPCAWGAVDRAKFQWSKSQFKMAQVNNPTRFKNRKLGGKVRQGAHGKRMPPITCVQCL